MTAASPLARLIATGVQAEAVVRAVVESLDADWDAHMAAVNGSNLTGEAQQALVKLEAIAPYRALLGAVVATWDTDDGLRGDMIRIGGDF